tara:strand:- start:1246 stop:3150 length:1905 start_codon:yes stop_codon:yes gene_type:complete
MSLKNIFQSLFLCLLAHTSFAQNTQTGLVREFNSDKKPLPNVGVEFFGAGATSSGIDGRFVLNFIKEKEPGALVTLQRVIKSGYEIVNETDLQGLRFTNDGKLAKDIVLAKNGVIDAAKAEYAGASLTALSNGYTRERDALIAQLENAKISEEAYQEQIKNLTESFDIQKVKLEALAATFARVNFDDANPIYQEALELYKEGKLKEAIAKLETVDLPKQTRDILAEIKSIADAESILNERKLNLEEKKTQHIEMLSSLADMYAINFDAVRAEGIMDTLLLLDSTDLVILQKSADFFREQHRYEKSKKLYHQIITHNDSEVWQKANAFGSLGDLETNTGDLSKAISFYQSCSDSYQALFETENSILNKINLATSYSRLGESYKSIGNFMQALEIFLNGSILSEELYEEYPNITYFKYGLAISFSKIGDIYKQIGDLEKAQNFYLDETKLFEELNKEFPNTTSFKKGLAISFSRLGVIQESLGNHEKALEYQILYSTLTEELYKKFPDDIDLKHSLAVSYGQLGNLHKALNRNEGALQFFLDETTLFKELNKKYPENVLFKYGLSGSYFSLARTLLATMQKRSELDDVMDYLNLSIKHLNELVEVSPQNVAYQSALSFVSNILKEIENKINLYESK